MKIKTKFNTGDTVYLLGGGGIEKRKIVSISACEWFSQKDELVFNLEYTLDDYDEYQESQLFGTKEELLKNL